MEWSTASPRSGKYAFYSRLMVVDLKCQSELQLHNRTVNQVHIKITCHLHHSMVQAWVVFLGDAVLS